MRQTVPASSLIPYNINLLHPTISHALWCCQDNCYARCYFVAESYNISNFDANIYYKEYIFFYIDGGVFLDLKKNICMYVT